MRPVKVLNIQFRTKPELIDQDKECYQRRFSNLPVMLDFKNAMHDDLPWDKPESILEGYDGVILGGSTEYYFDGGEPISSTFRQRTHHALQNMSPFLQYLFDNDIPTLGICMGHHFLGAFKGAWIRKDQHQQKVGTYSVNTMPDAAEHPLLAGVPETFDVIYGHKDCLDRVPTGARVILDSDRCHFSGIEYTPNIFSVQFHPEMTHQDVIARLRGYPEFLGDPDAAKKLEEVFTETPHQERIMSNFIQIVVGTQVSEQEDEGVNFLPATA